MRLLHPPSEGSFFVKVMTLKKPPEGGYIQRFNILSVNDKERFASRAEQGLLLPYFCCWVIGVMTAYRASHCCFGRRFNAFKCVIEE